MRTAVLADADDLAQAHVQGWRIGYRGIFPDEYLDAPEFEQQRVDRWRAWTWPAMTGSDLYAVTIDSRVVGFSHIGPERVDDVPSVGPIGEVYGFYLHPDAWGSGAATVLMEHSVQRLAQRAFTSSVLWVLRDNPRARAFYEKAGWHVSGRELMWPGPQTATHPPEPVPEVQYTTSLK